MRRNDFFKYLLLGGGNAASRSELETETLPYTFVSKSQRLKDYRIYGNTVDGESVGDLVETGEHTGEYCVPVKVEGKNLAHNIYITTDLNKYDKALLFDAELKPNTTYILSFNMTIGNVVYSNETLFNYTRITGTGERQYVNLTTKNNLSKQNINQSTGGRWIIFKNDKNQTTDNTFENIQLEEGSTVTPYEPYHTPVTTNLYLPEQIKMVGDEAEYVDYEEQKQYFADGTSIDVTLPALPTFPGTNTLSVGTTVQPSKVWIQGNVSEMPAQNLNFSPQSLQTFNLSENPQMLEFENNSLQPDVMPIEKPVLNLNDVSEIENAEIERGIESAE